MRWSVMIVRKNQRIEGADGPLTEEPGEAKVGNMPNPGRLSVTADSSQ